MTLEEDMDEEVHRRYLATCQVCRVYEDIAMLPAGDATEIGERGVYLTYLLPI
jgi:hypothetical protein